MSRHGELISIMRKTATRRSVMGSLTAATAGLTMRPAFAQEATPATPITSPETSPAATPGASSTSHLFVADSEVDLISIYSVPDGELTGQLEGIKFGTHGGTFLMPDGRLLFADLNAQEVVVLTVSDTGEPEIIANVPATFGNGVAWIAADPSLTWIMFGSLSGDDAEEEHLNIVNTADYTNLDLAFAMERPEEIHAWLLSDPLHLHVAVGGRIDSYEFAALQAGSADVLGSVEVDLGSHGGATDTTHNRILYVTGPGFGLDVLDVTSGIAEYETQIPWDLDGETGGRNARPRITSDGNHMIGVMTPELEDTSVWADTMVSNHIVNLETLEAQRLPVATGAFGYRWNVGKKYAMWVGYNADGNFAYLIDADSTSETFGESVASIPVQLPSNPWVAGEAWADGQEGYVPSTMTYDDAYGFVTISGDGLIQVIDLEAQEVIGEIMLDSPMVGGGFTTIVQAGIEPVDLWGR